MSYNPTQWSAGDTVTSAKLNKIEQGISNNGVLEINAIFETESGKVHLDKTWQEIYNANNSVIIIPLESEEFPIRTNVISVGYNGEVFIVRCFVDGIAPVTFSAATSNDYPSTSTKSGGNTQPMS